MYALKDEPKTRKELAQLMNTEPSRISYLFKKLKEAGCIHRIQGSDRMALSDLG
jgi:predicted transcriptional regulator